MAYEYNVREKWWWTKEDKKKCAAAKRTGISAERNGRLRLSKCDGDGVMDLFLLDVKR